VVVKAFVIIVLQ